MKNKTLIKDCIILFIITLVAGLALGAVYGITKEPIKQQEEKTQQNALKGVFADADSFVILDSASDEAAQEAIKAKDPTLEGVTMKAVYEAKDANGENIGYAFDVIDANGYGGNIELIVGIQKDGTVNGYQILSISETAGLGMNAKTDEFKNQYANKKVDSFTVTKTGAKADNEIDAISGATITSRAVTGAMNGCLYYFQSLEGGN